MVFFYQPKMDKVEKLRQDLMTEYEAKYGVKDSTVQHKSDGPVTEADVADDEAKEDTEETTSSEESTQLLEGQPSEEMVIHSDGDYKTIQYGASITCINPSVRTLQLLKLLDKPTFVEFAEKFNNGFEKNLDTLFKEEFEVEEIVVSAPETVQTMEPELKKDFTEAVKSLQKEFSVDDEDALFGRNRKVDRRVRSSKRKRY